MFALSTYAFKPICNLTLDVDRPHELTTKLEHLNSDALVTWGLDADTAVKRLYVMHEDRLSSGIPAFLVLWVQMRRYRWLTWIVGLFGAFQIACRIYDYVLAPAICPPSAPMEQFCVIA